MNKKDPHQGIFLIILKDYREREREKIKAAYIQGIRNQNGRLLRFTSKRRRLWSIIFKVLRLKMSNLESYSQTNY